MSENEISPFKYERQMEEEKIKVLDTIKQAQNIEFKGGWNDSVASRIRELTKEAISHAAEESSKILKDAYERSGNPQYEINVLDNLIEEIKKV